MPASTREVYLLLRARDEASRIIRGFSSELLRSAAQAQAAALRNEAMTHRQTAAIMKQQGATKAQIAAQIQAAQALENQARQLELNEQRSRRLAQSLTAVSSALETMGIALIITGGLALKFFFDSARLFAEYQRQVALTRTQIDGFSASMQEVGQVGLDIASKIPVAFDQIQPALFDIFSSTNANLEQSRILLEGFSKAAVAGQTDIQTAARGTIAIMNGLNIPFEDVNKVLDVQFELVRKGVGTYEEFANVFGRVIPAANRSQQSFETVAAMLAFMTRNGQSAAMAATAAARALELFTHPKAVKNLAEFGVKVKDAQGNFLPLIDILKQLRVELLKLPQADRVGKIVEIFKGSGFNIQARRFLEQVVLGAGELEDFTSLLESMGSASGVMEDKYGDMANTVAAKTQLLSNKWTALQLAVGEAATPALIELVDILGRVLDWFNNLDPKTKQMITRFTMFGAAATIALGVLLAFLGVITAIVAAFIVASTEILITIGVLTLLTTAVGAVGVAVATAWQQSAGFRRFLKDIKRDVDEILPPLKEFARNIKDDFTSKLLPALEGLQRVIEEKVIPAWNEFHNEVWAKARPAIIETLTVIESIAKRTFEVVGGMIRDHIVPAIRDLTDWWNKNKKELEPLIGILIQLAAWMAIIIALVVASGLIAAFMALAMAISSALAAVKLLTEAYKLQKANVELLIKVIKDLWNWIVSIPDKIRDMGEAFGGLLKSAGRSLIDGLIAGMKEKMNDLKSMLQVIAATISAFLPHSPAKRGPLSGSGSPFKSGQAISNMLASGMLDKLGILNAATTTVATAASPFGSASPSDFGSPPPTFGAPPPASGTTMVKNNYVDVTVNTQEIDPRTTSAELGFELAGRL